MKLKFFVTFFMISLCISCKNDTNDKILGTWKFEKSAKDPNSSSDITFWENDSARINIYEGKKLVMRFRTKYIFNYKDKDLTILFDTIPISYKVQKLDETELYLLSVKNKEVIKTKRVK